jgi:hypothetical protein
MEEERLKEVLKVVFGILKQQYSGNVGVDVFQQSDSETKHRYVVTLTLSRGINFDMLRRGVKKCNGAFAVKPDCTNYGGESKLGVIQFYLRIQK